MADSQTTYQTVAIRAALAQELYNNARELTGHCELLVREQQIQHHGWSTVRANHEDIVTLFKARADLFEQTYKQYLSNRDEHKNILEQFFEDLKTLSDVPVLPCLVNNTEQVMSLLDWINSNDDEHTNLSMVSDHCKKALDQMNDELLVNLQEKIETVLCLAEHPSMKEIKGISERLSGLDQIVAEARKKVQEQGELAQAILQNQQRARNINDPSILPDLCNSHREQLKVSKAFFSYCLEFVHYVCS